MGKTAYKKLSGSKSFRQRLLLATLSSTPILIEDIRADDTSPGLRPHEVSLLRLLDVVCDDCVIQIYETGTKLKYKPGVVMGGRNLEHDCGLGRAIGYFLEPLLVLALFAKKPLTIRLKGEIEKQGVFRYRLEAHRGRKPGITNDPRDPSVDSFQSTALPILKRFGVPLEGLKLKIESRGSPPNGGGEIILSVPVVQNLNAISWTDGGLVKRIRGVTFSTRVSSQFENSMIYAARGLFNPLLPDVRIATDHKSGQHAGNSPGFGISVVAETTTGCCISVDTAVSYDREEETDEFDDLKTKVTPAEEVGVKIASALLSEIEQGGVVDSTHQGLLFLLCALCPQDISKVRTGKLSHHGIETLRNIRDFLGVKFVIMPDPSSGTVLLTGLGCGLKNLNKKVS